MRWPWTDEKTFDLVGDGRGSLLSERRRLAQLMGWDDGPPEREPLKPTTAPTGALLRGGRGRPAGGGQVLAMRRRP